MCILITVTAAWGQSVDFTRFKHDSYRVDYPSHWMYKLQTAPDGAQLHTFVGPQERNALPYCYIDQQPINKALAPRAAQLNNQQKIELFSTGGEELLMSLYGNLASAQDFRMIYSNAAVLSRSFPTFTADFVFRVPQGFVYRVRSHLTYWKSAQLNLWCQAVSQSEADAEDAFRRNLPSFQRFVASLRIYQ